MAGLNYVISGLDLLRDYPEVKNYIKNYNGNRGFNFTGDSYSKYNPVIENQMSDILDADHAHSGSSWGYMLQGIQAVLNGTITREFIEQKIVEQQTQYNNYMTQLKLEKEKIEKEKIENEQREHRIETETSDKHL
jgi:hypothetical protein